MAQKAGRLSERLYRVLIPEAKKAVAPIEDWAALGTLAGHVRPQNQDRLLGGQFTSIDGKVFRMVAVSDGMGGLRNGQEAAALTLASVLWFLTSSNGPMDRRLTEAAHYANDQLLRRFNSASGATLSAVVVTGTGETIALNVGDSRVYGYRQSGGLAQISTDDTLAGLAGQGIDIDSRHNTNALLQHIGMGDGLEPHIHASNDIGSCEYFVLTTDGVHWVGNRLLSLIADNAEDHVQLTRRLLSLAEMTGAHDNASIATMCPRSFSSDDDGLADDTIDMELWTPQARTVMMSERQNPVAAAPPIRQVERVPAPPSESKLQLPMPQAGEHRVSDSVDAKPTAEPSGKRARRGNKSRSKKPVAEREMIGRPELFIEFEARKPGDD